MENVVVLCGGKSSSEREISIRSGNMVAEILARTFPTELIVLDEDALPDYVLSKKDAVIFPVTHGEFGEDGKLQKLMEEAGLCYIGSDSQSSALCMDKFSTKNIVSKFGIPVAFGVKFSVKFGKPSFIDKNLLTRNCVLKPNDKGSSVYVKKVNQSTFLDEVRNLYDGEFLLEEDIDGQDLSIGVLDGKALEVVQILPKCGFFDYENKYTPGASEEICPAHISQEATGMVKKYAEAAYKACNCRDWARIDFMIKGNKVFFLEINTVPGMTALSLYPLSAKAAGYPYEKLVKTLVNLAAARMKEA